MIRTAALVLLVIPACTLSDGRVPNRLDGFVTAPDLEIAAHANYTLCAGVPCTDVLFEIHRITDAGSVYAAETSGTVTADDAAPQTAAFEPFDGIPNGGQYHLVIDHWIEHLRVDASSGADQGALVADATITTPDEVHARLPDEITAGSQTALSWADQGTPVRATIALATGVPSPRFGFLLLDRPETGSFPLGPEIFNAVGDYNFLLERSLDHLRSNGDHHVNLIWTSSWHKTVHVIQPPPR